MLKLQTKASENIGLNVEGRKIEKVFCLNDEYPKCSDQIGFTVQVFELDNGSYIYFPPVESRAAEYYMADSLSEVYEKVRNLRNEEYIVSP